MEDHSYNLLPIRIWPDPVLLAKASVVDTFDKALAGLAEAMIETMYSAEGVGLAAPQVGHSIRMFVADPQTTEEPHPQVFINPELTMSGPIESSEEGCLSIPDIRVQVRRPIVATIRAQDIHGEWFELESDDFPARVWQHEYDHLDGKMILDRMSPMDRLATRKAVKAMRLDAQGKYPQ